MQNTIISGGNAADGDGGAVLVRDFCLLFCVVVFVCENNFKNIKITQIKNR